LNHKILKIFSDRANCRHAYHSLHHKAQKLMPPGASPGIDI
jgi:hypothetical protein